jgi:hypothetical protein
VADILPQAFDAQKFAQDGLANARVLSLGTWRDEMRERKQWYDGEQEDLITEALEDDCPETGKEIRKVFFGFCRKVVDKTAQVYWQPPIRELTQRGTVLDEDSDVVQHYQRQVERSGMDTILRVVDRGARLYVSEYVWVTVDDSENPEFLRLEPIDPQDLYVEQDPEYPGEISKCLKAFFPLQGRTDTGSVSATDRQMWMGFSQTEWLKFYGTVSDGAVSVDQEIDGGEHQYGRIPLTGFYDEDPRGRLFPTGGYLIPEANKTVAALFSHMYELAIMQAAGQAVVKSAFPYNKMSIGTRKAIQLKGPQDEFSFTSPQAQLDSFKDFLEWSLKAFAGIHDLPPSTFSTQSTELSGFAIALENLPLTRANQERQGYFVQWERDLFELVKLVNNAHLKTEIGEDVEQIVTFADLTYPIDPAVEWARDKEQIEAGLISPIELIMDRHPDMTREEAIERYQQNVADRKLIAEAQNPPAARVGIDFTRKRGGSPAQENSTAQENSPRGETDEEPEE